MEFHFHQELGEAFCQKHRPFPFLRQLKLNEKQQIDEVISFSMKYDQCLREVKNIKRWSERDKRQLLVNVQLVYLQLRKLKIRIYKHKNKYYVKKGRYFEQPKDWTITQSRKRFPWISCKIKNFTSQECFECYNQIIKSEEMFIRKVITEKYLEKYLQLKRRIEKLQCKTKPLYSQNKQVILENIDQGEEKRITICYCKKQVKDENKAVKCQNWNFGTCKQGGLYHQSCIAKLEKKEFQNIQSNWICRYCREEEKEFSQSYEQNQNNEGQETYLTEQTLASIDCNTFSESQEQNTQYQIQDLMICNQDSYVNEEDEIVRVLLNPSIMNCNIQNSLQNSLDGDSNFMK